jgi:autophagy-related protein 13
VGEQMSELAIVPYLFSDRYEPDRAKYFKFQIELDETPDFDHELETWNAYRTVDDPLPPLVLEVFLDISELTEKDTLLLVSEHGECDVLNYLKDCRSLCYCFHEPRTRCNEIILEWWKIEYSPAVPEPDQDFTHVLPIFYKQCIIHFRALFTITSSSNVETLESNQEKANIK